MSFIVIKSVDGNGHPTSFSVVKSEETAIRRVNDLKDRGFSSAYYAPHIGGAEAEAMVCNPVEKTVSRNPDWPPPGPTDEERINKWLSENPFADALIKALNRPTDDPDHLPPNAALPKEDLVAKIKANLT